MSEAVASADLVKVVSRFNEVYEVNSIKDCDTAHFYVVHGIFNKKLNHKKKLSKSQVLPTHIYSGKNYIFYCSEKKIKIIFP